MIGAELESTIHAYGAARHYHAATIDRWLHLDVADAAELLAVAAPLRLGENQLRDVWQCAGDIAARDGQSLAAVLQSPPVAAARQRPVGRNDKLALIVAALRRLRYPQLSAREDRIGALVRGLALPASVRIVLPEFLEGDALRIEIVATNAQGLRDVADCLRRAAESSTCREIFSLLEEAP